MFCAAAVVAAQNNEHKKPIIAHDNNCESNKALFDLVDISTPNDGLIIIISRLGSGETSRVYNHRRLHNIRTYLNYVREIPKERIVTAEGERVQGRGRAEVYVRGKLLTVFTVGRNQDLAGGDCEPASGGLYYPKQPKPR